MKKTSSFAILITIILTLSACGGGKVSSSSLERITSPDVSASALEQLVAGNTAFAFDLYHALPASGENQNFSPYSISLAFAMTYAGAKGDTASQMADVLGYTLPGEQLHAAWNALDLALARRVEQTSGLDEDDRFQLSIANSLWGQQDYQFLPEFLDLLALNYGAGMRLVDFAGDSKSARRQINNWVEDQTRNRIKDILAPGSLDPLTRLALVNAIYFKATWTHEFDPNETSDAPFYLLDGTQKTVDMMELEDSESFAYADGDGWQAIALPYKGGLADMVILMPDEGNFQAFETALDAAQYAGILASLETRNVLLSMPKFSFDTKVWAERGALPTGHVGCLRPGPGGFLGHGRHARPVHWECHSSSLHRRG